MRVLKIALQACGLDPKFYSGAALPKGSDCFDFPVESDLSWKGKKIAGGAAKNVPKVCCFITSRSSIPPGTGREGPIRKSGKGIEQVFGVSIENAAMDPGFYFEAARNPKEELKDNVPRDAGLGGRYGRIREFP